MLPGKIKYVMRDGVPAIIDCDGDGNAEICRFDESSDLEPSEAKTFLKAIVELWNDQF